MDIKINQFREFFDNIGNIKKVYKIINFDWSEDIVTVQWLENGKIERYTTTSTIRDRVLSELEKELL